MPSEMEVRKSIVSIIWCLLVAAACCDAKYYRIPNTLIGLGYITGVFLNISYYGPSGIKLFIINAIWPIVVLYILYLIGGLGAGDIKLFSVMSTMLTPYITYKSMLYSFFLAGSVAIFLCIKERKIIKRKLHFSFYILAGFFVTQYL